VFRWPDFPQILIIDTADYDVLYRFFNRLAFYVEKTGYRGKLWTDAELAGLHGWNAHDYNAPDLAAFFTQAWNEGFPLHDEENFLKELLLTNGIINADTEGGYRPGQGAVLGISRQSAAYLRQQFMVHEGYHGIYFIDADFRRFAAGRWNGLDASAKRFLRAYFAYNQYDPSDEALMINEFMAYCLERPASQVGVYLGRTCAERIAGTWRAESLPPADPVSGLWPGLEAAFSAEAAAFSAYVNERWGLAAGRISFVSFL
jgi:hypothetical protein